MVLLMGVRDEELTQKIIALDSTTPLQAVVNVCRAHEATRTATSAIRAPTASIAKISKYRQDKGRNHQPTSTPSNTSKACQSCNKSHNSAKCPAATSTCKNCGRKGHWARTPKCPALKVTCHYCTKTGHYDKCCRKKTGDTKADKSNATPPSSTTTNVCKLIRIHHLHPYQLLCLIRTRLTRSVSSQTQVRRSVCWVLNTLHIFRLTGVISYLLQRPRPSPQMGRRCRRPWAH